MKGKANEPVVVDEAPVSLDLVINVKRGVFSKFDHPLRATAHADFAIMPGESLQAAVERAMVHAYANLKIEIPEPMPKKPPAKKPKPKKKKKRSAPMRDREA